MFFWDKVGLAVKDCECQTQSFDINNLERVKYGQQRQWRGGLKKSRLSDERYGEVVPGYVEAYWKLCYFVVKSTIKIQQKHDIHLTEKLWKLLKVDNFRFTDRKSSAYIFLR